MECRKMERYVGSQVLDEPVAELLDFFGRIIVSWYEQGGHFEPHVCFVPDPSEGIENRITFSQAVTTVKIDCKSFQVDVCRIDMLEKTGACFRRNISCGNGHSFDITFVGCYCGIDDVLGKDDRI